MPYFSHANRLICPHRRREHLKSTRAPPKKALATPGSYMDVFLLLNPSVLRYLVFMYSCFTVCVCGTEIYRCYKRCRFQFLCFKGHTPNQEGEHFLVPPPFVRQLMLVANSSVTCSLMFSVLVFPSNIVFFSRY